MAYLGFGKVGQIEGVLGKNMGRSLSQWGAGTKPWQGAWGRSLPEAGALFQFYNNLDATWQLIRQKMHDCLNRILEKLLIFSTRCWKSFEQSYLLKSALLILRQCSYNFSHQVIFIGIKLNNTLYLRSNLGRGKYFEVGAKNNRGLGDRSLPQWGPGAKHL